MDKFTIDLGTWQFDIDILEMAIYTELLGDHNIRNDMPLIERNQPNTIEISHSFIYHLNGLYMIEDKIVELLKQFEKELRTKPLREIKTVFPEIEVIAPTNDEEDNGIIRIKKETK